ncbi:hypothetical protein JG688_00015328, partial [Phytophthora aleatoria]
RLAHIFNKSERTGVNWIKSFEETCVFQRAKGGSERVFSSDLRVWLLNYYQEHPLSDLDEAQDAFKHAHRIGIS